MLPIIPRQSFINFHKHIRNSTCRRLSISILPLNMTMVFLGIIVFFITNCQSPDQTIIAEINLSSFDTGQYQIFEVTETTYGQSAAPTIRIYQQKEIFTELPVQQFDRRLFRINRYQREKERQSWQPDSIFGIQVFSDRIIRTENGISYVKYLLPVQDQLVWDGNKLNTLGPDYYQFCNTRKALAVLNQIFPETVTVMQQNDSTRVSQNKRLEIYAPGVGLVYRENTALTFCPECTEKIAYGYQRIMRILSYGKQ